MPWGVGIILSLALAGGAFQWYVLRRTILALAAVTGWPKKRIRLPATVPVIWFALYPLLFIGSYALGLVRVARALQSAEMPLDGLVVYPFWIWLAVSVQIGICLLVFDGVRLVLFPLYKKHQLRWRKLQPRLVIPHGVPYNDLLLASTSTHCLGTSQTESMSRACRRNLMGFELYRSRICISIHERATASFSPSLTRSTDSTLT